MQGRQLFRSASLLTGTSMVFLSGVVWAQTTRGVIVGRVSDPAAAVVQEAKVTLSNENTGITTGAITGAQGDYTFTNVEPGIYKVTVAAPGFRTAVVRNVHISVDQTVRVDVQLALGDVATEVDVQATLPVVQSETSSIGSVIDGKQINALPLNGRTGI